jgi:NitT/TauT family transport system permease protein
MNTLSVTPSDREGDATARDAVPVQRAAETPLTATPAARAPRAVATPSKQPPLLARPKVQRIVYPVLVGVVLLALWQGLVSGLELPSYLVPSPLLMLQTLVTDWATLGGSLWVTVKITLFAFVVATVAGVLISFLFVQSKAIETALFPYAVLLQVTPIVAVAPLIIIWVRDPTLSMVICASLVALFPIISNTTLGLRSVEPDLQSYFVLNRATRLQTLWRLRIPSALPYFFGGLRISSGLALIGAVVAEFVAGTGGTGAGLAYQILQAGFQLNIPRMFAALLLISLTGVALFVLMAWLSKLALGGWHASETSHD